MPLLPDCGKRGHLLFPHLSEALLHRSADCCRFSTQRSRWAILSSRPGRHGLCRGFPRLAPSAIGSRMVVSHRGSLWWGVSWSRGQWGGEVSRQRNW